MKSLPHARLLLALSLALLGSSAFALVSRLAPVRAEVRTVQLSPHVAADGQSQVRVERAELRARFERAPQHSRRVLLPEFVLVDDAPDDEDLADLRAEHVRMYPEDAEPSLDEVARSPRLPPRDLLERPPRA